MFIALSTSFFVLKGEVTSKSTTASYFNLNFFSEDKRACLIASIFDE